MTSDQEDVVERLDARFNEIARYCERSEPSDVTRRAPEHLALYADSKAEILRLRRDNENKKLIIDMLRAQIRTLGHMPVVVENKEAEQDDLGRKVDFVSTIDRLRSRVEELEWALKNAEPIAELLRTVSSFLDGWIFADIKPDGEQIQREADGLRTDVDVALAYSPVFSALSPSKDEFLAKHLTELQNENPNAGKLKKATV